MSYSVVRQTDPDAIVVTFNADFDFKEEAIAYNDALFAALDVESDPVTVIINILEAPISFDNLLLSTRDSRTRPYSNPAQHPNTKDMKLVTDSSLMRASINGFKKLGIAKNIGAYQTLDAALNDTI